MNRYHHPTPMRGTSAMLEVTIEFKEEPCPKYSLAAPAAGKPRRLW